MIKENGFHHIKRLWLIIVISGALISASFAMDWIGLSEPGDFSNSQILLIVVGLLVLLLGVLGRRVVSVYRGGAILLLNTVILLVCLEMAAGVILKVIPNKPKVAPEMALSYYRSQEWSEEYWREFSAVTSNEYVPWTVWRTRPFKGNTINISEDGIRFTPGVDCGPDSYKVFAFGGSTMWGWGAPDWGTIPTYLQTGLESLSEKPVCVVNFGEVAYVSTQGLIELLIQLRSGNVPDLVIFYDGINDISAAWQSGQAGTHQNLSDIADRFKGRNRTHPLISWLNRFYLTALFKRFLPEESGQLANRDDLITYEDMGVDAETLANSVVRAYLGNYEIVDALAQQYGFEYYFFWQPSILIGDKPLTSEEQPYKSAVDRYPAIIKLFDLTYRDIEQAANEYQNLYYIADIFDEIDTLLWIEQTHVTPEGNQLVAQKMLDVIKKSQLLTSK